MSAARLCRPAQQQRPTTCSKQFQFGGQPAQLIRQAAKLQPITLKFPHGSTRITGNAAPRNTTQDSHRTSMAKFPRSSRLAKRTLVDVNGRNWGMFSLPDIAGIVCAASKRCNSICVAAQVSARSLLNSWPCRVGDSRQ